MNELGWRDYGGKHYESIFTRFFQGYYLPTKFGYDKRLADVYKRQRYYHTRIGVGGRMDTLQCAVVLGKLERFEWEVEQRINIGARYQQLLADLPNGARTVTVRPDRDSVWACLLYTSRCV